MMELIDKQAAIDEIDNYEVNAPDYMQGWAVKLIEAIKGDIRGLISELPSVQSEPIKLNIDHELTKDEYEKLRKDWADAPIVLQPERKTGRWIVKTVNTFEMAYGSTGYEPVYECSLCGGVEESYLRFDEPIMPEDADFPNYCPNRGASMVRGEEDE